jgi:hypothetical protein
MKNNKNSIELVRWIGCYLRETVKEKKGVLEDVRRRIKRMQNKNIMSR